MTESRADRKERTRQALLDGALDLMADASLTGLSLREVARSAGIVPTAFYRHFTSLDDLGIALAEDAMRMLRRLLREIRRDPAARNLRTALTLLTRQVRADEARFRFLARERFGGVAEVRRTIAGELRVLAVELAHDLAQEPPLHSWPAADLDMLADLLVRMLMTTVVDLLEADRQGEPAVLDRAERQLRLVLVGTSTWQPGPGRPPSE